MALPVSSVIGPVSLCELQSTAFVPFPESTSSLRELVRVLRLPRFRMQWRTTKTEARWRGGADWRIVCDCQLHARREKSLLRRVTRVAKRVRSRGLVLLIGIPLAFGTFDLPSEAMNLAPWSSKAPQIVEQKVTNDFS